MDKGGELAIETEKKEKKGKNNQLLIIGGVAVLALVVGGFFFNKTRSRKYVMTDEETGQKVVVETQNEGSDCPVGSYVDYAGEGRFSITGKEMQTLGGQTVELCCAASEDVEDENNAKYCYGTTDETEGYVMMWAQGETSGKLYKYMESYPQNGKTCTTIYQETGAVMTEACQ